VTDAQGTQQFCETQAEAGCASGQQGCGVSNAVKDNFQRPHNFSIMNDNRLHTRSTVPRLAFDDAYDGLWSVI
jgi:hypothetical protein